jgi:hypothetical protein
MLDLLPVTLRFAAAPFDDVLSLDLTLTDPDRSLVLDLRHGEARVRAAGGPDDEPAGATSLELPAEALLRLVYGRLDPRHTPPLKVSDDTLLVRLREIFRGF